MDKVFATQVGGLEFRLPEPTSVQGRHGNPPEIPVLTRTLRAAWLALTSPSFKLETLFQDREVESLDSI